MKLSKLVQKQIDEQKQSYEMAIKRLKTGVNKNCVFIEDIMKNHSEFKYDIYLDSWAVIVIIRDIEKMTDIIPLLKDITKNGYRIKHVKDYPSSNFRNYVFIDKNNDNTLIDIQIRIILSNENNYCKYVQTGTKTIEQPIFELQCGGEKFNNGEDVSI